MAKHSNPFNAGADDDNNQLRVRASTFSALRLAPIEFAREMRIAAAIQWYTRGIVSQDKAAELAGLARSEFLEELYRRRDPAYQVITEDLADEIQGIYPLGVERLAADSPRQDPTLVWKWVDGTSQTT
jgi:predicted HTH domain antitoxin